MLENLILLLQNIDEEITKKFSISQNLSKIKDLYQKDLELILNYFLRCFQHTDTGNYYKFFKMFL